MAETSAEMRINCSEADSRWKVLAGLRFVLAMVVVAGHLMWFVPAGQPWIFLTSLGGTSAVLGFLVISGYSIAHSLQRRPDGFLRRRVLRIYPMYMVAVLYALLPFFSGADAFGVPGETFARPHFWVVVGNLLMLQNIVCVPVDSNTLVWTLGVEVVCYLLAPLFRKMGTFYLVILITISAGAYGCYPWLGLGHYATLLYGLPLLMFAWAWMAGFILQRYRNSLWVGLAVAGLCVGLTIVNTSYNQRYSMITVTVAALIVTLGPHIPVPRQLGNMLNYLGDLSYPIYLFHLPTFILGYGIMGITSSLGLIAMALVISAALLFMESILRRVFLSRNPNIVPTPG